MDQVDKAVAQITEEFGFFILAYFAIASIFSYFIPILSTREMFASLDVLKPKIADSTEKNLEFIDKLRGCVDLRDSIRKNLIQFFGSIIFFGSILLAVLDVYNSQEGQITERFRNATGQIRISDDKNIERDIPFRMGGIYSLDRVANDSEKDFKYSVDILASYIQSNNLKRASAPTNLLSQTIIDNLLVQQNDAVKDFRAKLQEEIRYFQQEETRYPPEKGKDSVNKYFKYLAKKLSEEKDSTEYAKILRRVFQRFSPDDETQAEKFDSAYRKKCGTEEQKALEFCKVHLNRLLASGWAIIRLQENITDLKSASEATAALPADLRTAFNVIGNLAESNLKKSAKDDDLPSKDYNLPSLVGVNFTEMPLAFVKLPGLDLSAALLYKTNLAKANLQKTKLVSAFLNEANLIDADLRNAKLNGARLNEALLSGANMEEAILRNASMSKAHLIHACLKNAKLESAVLAEADLRGANLQGAHLESVDFAEAKLEKTDLRGAYITGARNLKLDQIESAIYDENILNTFQQTDQAIHDEKMSNTSKQKERSELNTDMKKINDRVKELKKSAVKLVDKPCTTEKEQSSPSA